MGRVRFFICVIFVIACVTFAGYQIKTRMVEDNKAPVITCDEEEITISVEDDDAVLLEGLKAEDNRDGDITDSIRVSSMSHFVNGKRTVKYVVFDKANNVGVLERTVKYSDYTSPKVYLKKPLRFITTASGRLDYSEHYEAVDCLDGDITHQVRLITSDNDRHYGYSTMEGLYDVTLQVNNNAGDVRSLQVEMQISYTDNDDEREKVYPMLSDYIVYTTVGKKIDTAKYLTGTSRNGNEYEFEDTAVPEKGDITVKSNVDYTTPGVYTVEYSYKAEGAKKAVTKMYVVVEEK